jgi:hypothetical protein
MPLKDSMKEASKTYKALPDRYEKRVALRGKKTKEPSSKPKPKPKKKKKVKK